MKIILIILILRAEKKYWNVNPISNNLRPLMWT